MGNTKEVPVPDADDLFNPNAYWKYHILQAIDVDYERDDFEYSDTPFWTANDRFEQRDLTADEWATILSVLSDDLSYADIDTMPKYEILERLKEVLSEIVPRRAPYEINYRHQDKTTLRSVYFALETKGFTQRPDNNK